MIQFPHFFIVPSKSVESPNQSNPHCSFIFGWISPFGACSLSNVSLLVFIVLILTIITLLFQSIFKIVCHQYILRIWMEREYMKLIYPFLEGNCISIGSCSLMLKMVMWILHACFPFIFLTVLIGYFIWTNLKYKSPNSLIWNYKNQSETLVK